MKNRGMEDVRMRTKTSMDREKGRKEMRKQVLKRVRDKRMEGRGHR